MAHAVLFGMRLYTWLVTTERIDWNNYGVFRYFPPKQYGREPDFACAEYVLHDLREFEKLPAAEPCEEDYCILNGIFACVGQMKPHNMDIALVNEIRGKKFLDATGNAVHCISLYVAYWKVPHIGAFCITLQTAARSAVIVTGFRFIPYSIGVEKME